MYILNISFNMISSKRRDIYIDKLDIVFTWVDHSDKEWVKKKNNMQ